MTLTLAPRPAWYDNAACRAFGPQIFYTEGHGQGWQSVQMVRRAKRICGDCPVRADCLADNIDEPYGIWGGTTPLERRRLRQGLAAEGTEARPEAHGTDRGYYRHRSRQEPPCAECKAAHSAITWEREKRRRNVDALASWADTLGRDTA